MQDDDLKQQAVEFGKQWYQNHGYYMRLDHWDVRRDAPFGRSTLLKLFGSWNNYTAELGKSTSKTVLRDEKDLIWIRDEATDRDPTLTAADGSLCWKWNRAVHKGVGYGQLTVNKEHWQAHRYVYWLCNPDWDYQKHSAGIVTHDCDNRICCNPDHLRLGDKRSNAAEAVFRDRIDFQAIAQRRNKEVWATMRRLKSWDAKLNYLMSLCEPHPDAKQINGSACRTISPSLKARTEAGYFRIQLGQAKCLMHVLIAMRREGIELTTDEAREYTKTANRSNGKQVLHLCDNRDCLNPDHIHRGTIKDNMRQSAASRDETKITAEMTPIIYLAHALSKVCPTLNTREVWNFLGNEWGVKPDSVRMYVHDKHRLNTHEETLKNYIEFFKPHIDSN
jgi:hypothetical protein